MLGQNIADLRICTIHIQELLDQAAVPKLGWLFVFISKDFMAPALIQEFEGMIIKDVMYDCDTIRISFVNGKKIDLSDSHSYFKTDDNPGWLKGRMFKDLVRGEGFIRIVTYDGIVTFQVSKK